MNDAIAGRDVRCRDVGVIDLHCAALDLHIDHLAVDRFDFVEPDDIGGQRLSGDNVIGEDFDELRLVLRLEQIFNGPLRKLRESSIRGREHGERTFALQGGYEVRRAESCRERRELSGGDSGVNDVLLCGPGGSAVVRLMSAAASVCFIFISMSPLVELSTAMLPKIERGQLFPTLPTLVRIALVFGVDLAHFFSKERPRLAVTRKDERVRLPIPAGASCGSYMFESLNYPLPERRMEAFPAVFSEGGPASEPHQHGAEEIIYVLEGSLTVTVDEEVVTLAEGDSISFDSSVPHHYQREGKGDCTALVVTVD